MDNWLILFFFWFQVIGPPGDPGDPGPPVIKYPG